MITGPIQNHRTIILSLMLCILAPFGLFAQKKSKTSDLTIPMQADRWTVTDASKAEFIQHKGVQSLKLSPGSGQALLKEIDFTDGTIEFDVESTDPKYSFVTMYFHQESEKERECFYLRIGKPNAHKRIDAVQYAPYVDGVNLWDLFYQYQGSAPINITDRNHIKLVISGKQLRAYVNDMQKPALEIPRMEGNATHGAIAFEGVAVFNNLVIKPGATEGLHPSPGVDLTNHDPNYIRKWMVTNPVTLERGVELTDKNVPGDSAQWTTIEAERAGLINLTRRFGMNEVRKYVWLKVKITAEKAHNNKMQLGFSDEVWVVLNNRLLYLDKNFYPMLVRKAPDGRIGLENGSFPIPLNEGENTLMICVANDFFGWGIIARLESLEGVEIQ